MLLFFGSELLLTARFPVALLTLLYVATVAAGYISLLTAGTWISRLLKNQLMDDVFNDENESFMQERRLIANEYSVNLPTRFRYQRKTYSGWINVINPFRASLILGTPGSGKSYAIINNYIRQQIEKGFAAYIYDFKYPDLSIIAYNQLLKNKDKYAKPVGFYVINFDDPRYSHRCNPLNPSFLSDIADAYESAYVIMLNLNKSWIQKQGDFFVESPIVLFAAVIWYLKIYENGKFCTFPHAIELLNKPYSDLFTILTSYRELENYLSPFMDAWKGGAMEQLQGQIASAKIPLSRLISPALYWIMTGDDFTLDINNPEEPKVLCVGNNPDRQNIYSCALGLYNARIVKMVNRKGRLKCSILVDEVPTLYFKGLDTLIATARSNKVAVCLGAQDFSQLIRDYGASIDVTIKNHAPKKKNFDIRIDIIDKQTGETLYGAPVRSKLSLATSAQETFTCDIKGLKPKLWEPATPNLYDFRVSLTEGKNKVTDCITVTSGFRTFESKDGFLYLNGRKYWLRGGNHIPFALCPNDSLLADKFMKLMKEGNVQSTRTHTTPWNELWVSATDRNGIAISFEGTWSWLMIHSTPIPDKGVLDLWSSEWLRVMKKYRNHPSVFFWTVNNEMKFYDLDADTERAKQKFRIVSNVVKDMRKTDPTRPVCFDSNYLHNKASKRFGDNFLKTVDDGDIDDNHAYYNWYDYSVFRFFNGEFQKQFKSPGRPLISQEMSTGYPNAETGHPTRSYQLIHQNPYSLIGYEAYDWGDPASFLNTQSFITGELAETLRRTNEQASGIMHFAYMTWFRQCYDHQNIQPYPTYYAMQRAMQPVLVSAELWGRNLYAGEKLHTRIYVVNDNEEGRDLKPTSLAWSIVDETNKVLASGTEQFPAVEYYGRKYIEPNIHMPSNLPADKVNVKLKLTLTESGVTLSQNEYGLLVARKEWNIGQVTASKKILLLDKDHMKVTLDFLDIACQTVPSIKELLNAKQKANLCIISGLKECTDEEARLLREYQSKGGRILFLNSKEAVQKVYPEYITGWIIPTEGDIVVMERNDAPVFDGIGALELRYFNNNKREIPLACTATLKAIRHENVKELAAQMKIHAYIDGGKPEERIARIESMRGLTLLQIADNKGKSLVSTLCTEKATTDPIAGKLLVNMVNELLK